MLAWGTGSRYRRDALVRAGLKQRHEGARRGRGNRARCSASLCADRRPRPGHRSRPQPGHDGCRQVAQGHGDGGRPGRIPALPRQPFRFPEHGLCAAPHQRPERGVRGVRAGAEARRAPVHPRNHPGAKPAGPMAAQDLHARGDPAPDAPRFQPEEDHHDVALLLGHHRSLRPARNRSWPPSARRGSRRSSGIWNSASFRNTTRSRRRVRAEGCDAACLPRRIQDRGSARLVSKTGRRSRKPKNSRECIQVSRRLSRR